MNKFSEFFYPFHADLSEGTFQYSATAKSTIFQTIYVFGTITVSSTKKSTQTKGTFFAHETSLWY